MAERVSVVQEIGPVTGAFAIVAESVWTVGLAWVLSATVVVAPVFGFALVVFADDVSDVLLGVVRDLAESVGAESVVDAVAAAVIGVSSVAAGFVTDN